MINFLRPNERTAVFIDGANMYSSCRLLNIAIDFQKMRTLFDDNCDCVRKFYYTAVQTGDDHDPLRRTLDWLDYNGYHLVTKPMKEFTRDDGTQGRKGNMDIEIAIDVLTMVEHVQHMILFTGDGDFRRLVEEVQRRGRRVTAISSAASSADSLRRQVDAMIDLKDIRELIEKPLR